MAKVKVPESEMPLSECASPSGGQPVFIGTEGKLVEEVAGKVVADVEAGIRFFGQQVLPVLRHHCTCAAVAADRAGVVDGMAIGVGGSQRDPAAADVCAR